MAGQNTLTFTDRSFDRDVLESEVPVLVDFWAKRVHLAERWRLPSTP
jgi:hypothetical protein